MLPFHGQSSFTHPFEGDAPLMDRFPQHEPGDFIHKTARGSRNEEELLKFSLAYMPNTPDKPAFDYVNEMERFYEGYARDSSEDLSQKPPTSSSIVGPSGLEWITPQEHAVLNARTIQCPMRGPDGRRCGTIIDSPGQFPEHLKEHHGVRISNVSSSDDTYHPCRVGLCKAEVKDVSYLRHIERHTTHFVCPFKICPTRDSAKRLNRKTGTVAQTFSRSGKFLEHITEFHSVKKLDKMKSMYGKLTYTYAVFDKEINLGHLAA